MLCTHINIYPVKLAVSLLQWIAFFPSQPEMLSSLVLSMLKQMLLDDKDDDVREAVVRSLGLLAAFISDPDKYSQVGLNGHWSDVKLCTVSVCWWPS